MYNLPHWVLTTTAQGAVSKPVRERVNMLRMLQSLPKAWIVPARYVGHCSVCTACINVHSLKSTRRCTGSAVELL